MFPRPALRPAFWAAGLLGLALWPLAAWADRTALMDQLLSQDPGYATPRDRAEALPPLLAMWQEIGDCLAKVNVWETDLQTCVTQVHDRCLNQDLSDQSQRDCWAQERFAWAAQRLQTRAELVAHIRKNAAESPEFYPKIGPDADYSAEGLIARLAQFDAAADKAADLTCAMEVTTQGYDPNRQTPPLTALNTDFSCPIDLAADRIWRYLRWAGL